MSFSHRAFAAPKCGMYTAPVAVADGFRVMVQGRVWGLAGPPNGLVEQEPGRRGEWERRRFRKMSEEEECVAAR